MDIEKTRAVRETESAVDMRAKICAFMLLGLSRYTLRWADAGHGPHAHPRYHATELGGVKENFYRGRHRLKTYVRVQESSRNVMRVRVWAETLVIQGVLFGVTTVAGMLQAWRYTYRTAWCSMEDEMESSTESASASRLRA